MYIYSNFTIYDAIKILIGKVFSDILNMTLVYLDLLKSLYWSILGTKNFAHIES